MPPPHSPPQPSTPVPIPHPLPPSRNPHSLQAPTASSPPSAPTVSSTRLPVTNDTPPSLHPSAPPLPPSGADSLITAVRTHRFLWSVDASTGLASAKNYEPTRRPRRQVRHRTPLPAPLTHSIITQHTLFSHDRQSATATQSQSYEPTRRPRRQVKQRTPPSLLLANTASLSQRTLFSHDHRSATATQSQSYDLTRRPRRQMRHRPPLPAPLTHSIITQRTLFSHYQQSAIATPSQSYEPTRRPRRQVSERTHTRYHDALPVLHRHIRSNPRFPPAHLRSNAVLHALIDRSSRIYKRPLPPISLRRTQFGASPLHFTVFLFPSFFPPHHYV
jgi:hypothetical protein